MDDLGYPYFGNTNVIYAVCNTPFIHIAIPTLCSCMEQMRFSVCLLDMDVYVCPYLHRCSVYIYFRSLTCADPFQQSQRFPFGKMILILSKATCWYHWENTLAIVPKIFSPHAALYNPCIASGFVASSAMGGPWNETHGPSQREGLGSDLCTVSH